MPRQALAILAAAVVVVVVVVVVVATSGGAGSAPTKTQYTARANAICNSAGAKTGPLIKRLTTAAAPLLAGKSAPPQLASEVQQLHTVAAGALANLRALKPPSAAHAQIEQFLTPFAAVTQALGQAAKDASAGQAQKALLDVEAVQPASQQMTSAAKAAGLTACANALAVVP